MRLTKPFIGMIVVVCCVAPIVVFKAIQAKRSAATTTFSSHADFSAKTLGDVGASVRVIEYTDFQCPACAHAAGVIRETMEKYPGKIYLELKYFPLDGHLFARRAAVYAECAAEQGKFWPFHDVIYKSQPSWAKMLIVDDYFSQLAVSLGIDGVRLSACVNGGAMDAKVQKDVQEGARIGVNSTPTFFINGKMVVGSGNFLTEVESLLGTHEK